MPLPAKVVERPGVLELHPNFSYAFTGDAGPRLQHAAQRLVASMEQRTGIQMAHEPAIGSATLTIAVPAVSAPEAVPQPNPQPNMDESYTLDIDSAHIVLTARTDIGALRGLETLLQLVGPVGSGYALPAAHIEDAPRFAWRGLMIDSGRHFEPLPVILRTLDAMASVKLNVFHWHLTEDQGFRIESKTFPELHQKGSGGQFYTQDQVREVIAYASDRGIRVVPEFDVPGHTQSWLVGHPELGSAPGPFALDPIFGISDDALDPSRESTFEFLDKFFAEMAALFPDPYLHAGGDESNGKEWRANPAIAAFMQQHGFKTTEELQTYFSQRVVKILAAHHKQMVGWDEILSPGLPAEAVIQSWRGTQYLSDAARQGHLAILSKPWYLDHPRSSAEIFAADPLPADTTLTVEQQKLILGGEACMWGEHVTPATIDSRIWPRAAVVAERLWSPATDRDVDSMYRRLATETLRLEYEGLMHLSGPVRVERLLAGSAEIHPLEIFVATLQPVDFHVRSQQQHPNTLTVFDRLVDAARPDPALRHELPPLVDAAIAGDAAARAQLRTLFQSWLDAAPAVEKLEANSPILQEAHIHIAAWPQLATLGLDALHALDRKTPQPAAWLDAQTTTLHDAVAPQELVDFVVLAPLQKLAEAAASAH
jgi:hexosaminidase